MKKYMLAALAVTVLAPNAQAASYKFSFIDDENGSSSSHQYVTGIIDGLVEGVNPISAVSVTITSGLGVIPDGYKFSHSADYCCTNSFTVTDGEITRADAYWADSDYVLSLGTDPGQTTYYPSLFNYQTGTEIGSYWTPATFTLVAPGAVPEPASWAMMIGGFGMIGGAARYRRHRATAAFA